MNRILGLFVICATSLFLTFSQAHGQALTSFGGYWSGEAFGEVDPGKREKLKCFANNVASGSGMKMTIRCSGSASAVRIEAMARENAGKLSGTWQEITYGVNGTLSGTVDASSIKGRIVSPNFKASVNLQLSGKNKMQVSLTPTEGTLRFIVALSK